MSSDLDKSCISPPPLSTGEPASDVLNIIMRKNSTFLDISDNPIKTGWTTIYSINSIFFFLIIIAFLETGPMGGIAFLIFDGILFIPMWMMLRQKLNKPLYPSFRLNRERCEVYIRTEDKGDWVVPWESVRAFAPSATRVSPFGATEDGALILWFPFKGEENEPYYMEKAGYTLMYSPGSEHAALGQWECIRSFMEIGPAALPESLEESLSFSSQENLRRSFIEAKEHFGLFLAVLWYGFVGHILTNPLLGHWLIRKKLLPLPELPGEEAKEWSKPLPREQWAKRSPELEQAIAEREDELMAQPMER